MYFDHILRNVIKIGFSEMELLITSIFLFIKIFCHYMFDLTSVVG